MSADLIQTITVSVLAVLTAVGGGIGWILTYMRATAREQMEFQARQTEMLAQKLGAMTVEITALRHTSTCYHPTALYVQRAQRQKST